MAEPTTDGPYTAAVKAGRCPLCRGTGAWPPPEPPPLIPLRQHGWSR